MLSPQRYLFPQQQNATIKFLKKVKCNANIITIRIHASESSEIATTWRSSPIRRKWKQEMVFRIGFTYWMRSPFHGVIVTFLHLIMMG